MAHCRFCKEDTVALGMCDTHYQYANRWHKAGLRRALKHRDKLHLR